MAFQNSIRKMRIRDPGKIPQTVAQLESVLTGCPPACVLICEELLNHLAAAGMREILVSVRGKWNRRIEIRAAGDEDDLLKRLPDGLNSPVLENGSNLSGDQRQRIAIARALLRNPQIILFDEATSALDSESEEQVSKAIDEIMKHTTVVMVAHRLNTLRKNNRIYRLENGKVIPCDSYDELIKSAASDGIH